MAAGSDSRRALLVGHARGGRALTVHDRVRLRAGFEVFLPAGSPPCARARFLLRVEHRPMRRFRSSPMVIELSEPRARHSIVFTFSFPR